MPSAFTSTTGFAVGARLTLIQHAFNIELTAPTQCSLMTTLAFVWFVWRGRRKKTVHMQKSRIIITLLVICPAAAALGSNDHQGRSGAKAVAEAGVEAGAVSNGPRLNYNLVASYSLCYFLYLFLWIRMYLCVPLDLVALQKLAVVFICFCSNRPLVVVIVVVLRSVFFLLCLNICVSFEQR